MNRMYIMWRGWIALTMLALVFVACGPPPRPETPGGLATDQNQNVNGIIVMTWNTVEDKEVIGYRLYRSTSPDSGFENVYDTGPVEEGKTVETKYIDKNVIVGENYETKYYYKVTSYKKGYGDGEFKERNESEMSAAVQANSINTSPPNSTTGVTVKASNIDTPQIEIKWKAGIEPDLKGYYVWRSDVNQPISVADEKNRVSQLVETKAGEAPRWVDKDVSPGKEYCYNIQAVDRGGLKSQLVPSIRKCDLLLERIELETPTNKSTTTATPKFQWKELTNAAGYIVALKASRDFGGEIWRSSYVTGTSTTYNGKALDTGSTYYWYVYSFTSKPSNPAEDLGNSVSEIRSFTVQ